MKIVKDKVKQEIDMNALDNISSAPAPEKKGNWIINTLGLICSGIAITIWHFAKKPILIALRWIVISGGFFLAILFTQTEKIPPSVIALSIVMIVIGAIGVALIKRD